MKNIFHILSIALTIILFSIPIITAYFESIEISSEFEKKISGNKFYSFLYLYIIHVSLFILTMHGIGIIFEDPSKYKNLLNKLYVFITFFYIFIYFLSCKYFGKHKISELKPSKLFLFMCKYKILIRITILLFAATEFTMKISEIARYIIHATS